MPTLYPSASPDATVDTKTTVSMANPINWPVTFDGHKWLVIRNFYWNMLILWQLLPSQCNSAKVILILKELFPEHGVPESVKSDGSPQFSSTPFAEFTDIWKFDYVIISPHNHRTNWFVEAMVKAVKGILICAKSSGQDPQLVLLSQHITPIDSHLTSPDKLLYQYKLYTTLPLHLWPTENHVLDVQDYLNQYVDNAKHMQDSEGFA